MKALLERRPNILRWPCFLPPIFHYRGLLCTDVYQYIYADINYNGGSRWSFVCRCLLKRKRACYPADPGYSRYGVQNWEYMISIQGRSRLLAKEAALFSKFTRDWAGSYTFSEFCRSEWLKGIPLVGKHMMEYISNRKFHGFSLSSEEYLLLKESHLAILPSTWKSSQLFPVWVDRYSPAWY